MTTVTEAEQVAVAGARRRQVLARLGPFLGLIAVIAVFALMTDSPSQYLSVRNFRIVVAQTVIVALGAIGMTMIIVSGGIDLSVGSAIALTGVVTALGLRDGMTPLVALLLGVGAGGVIGLVNGLAITRLKVIPFIATLGMLGVARGVVVGSTNGNIVAGFPDAFTNLGQGYVGPVPIPVIFMLVLAIIVSAFLSYHVWGTYLYAIGGNETSALLTGLPVSRVKLFAYVASGLLSGLAGILVVARLGISAPTQSVGYELNVVAAAVIGGVSLQGGRGTVAGAVLGAIIIGVLNNALVLLNVPSYWQQAFIGGIILLAALVDRLRQGRS
jgi:ribose transport system permease protein